MKLVDARRIAIRAQRLGDRPAAARLADVRALVDRLAVIQVDSVNVVCRSQELPVWARLGPHARDALPALCKRGAIFEYWAHEASLVPVALQPLLRWRMAEARDKAWRSLRALVRRDPGYVEAVRAEVHARGQLLARDLEASEGGKRAPGGRKVAASTGWWGWDDRKRALAYLFWAGEITAIRSPTTFERVYAPLDRVLPAKVIAAATPSTADAHRGLIDRAARALGIATAADLADYFRLKRTDAKPRIAELVEARRLRAVSVEGWREPAYVHASAPAPSPITAASLLSPFDSLIWFRPRTERLFDFHYRIGIYTPADQRVHGYYVLPFLLDDALVARVDLKADRAAGALRVQAAFAEPGAPAHTADALAGELAAFARWLGLDTIAVGRRGGLARALGAAVKRSR
ncbi:MAG TPA: crosslink repair DNA glycosylase YcaQ family protein [Kofleriaceae bacterium]|nr:crosslink repair DNA glycosylase YcaQ family protein [Kofleriaceae bacterium]